MIHWDFKMAKKATENNLQQVAALAVSANDQLKELYGTLGMVVTAVGTLSEELSELPKAKDIQEVVEGLRRLREELDWFVEPEWQIPTASELYEAAEAAGELADKVARVDQS
jgi:hypothetical protein